MAKRCEICNIELDERDFANHVKGKKHLKKLEAENFKKGLIEKSIFVSRMPPGLGIQEIVNFFTQFGVIERCKLEPNFAIIEFQTKQPVNFLLSRPIWMGRHKLEIKRRRLAENHQTKKNKSPDSEKSPAEIVFADLKTKLQSQTTFDSELSTFLETIQLNEEVIENNWKLLHSSLLETFRPAFPNCGIFRFGSSVTGLAFKGSDFDIYLNIGQPIYEEEEMKQGWTPRTIFKEVKFLMYKTRNIFDRIVLIPKAKTPIIKFFHVPTVTNCDISFKNGLGVINSQLIKKLLCFDVRIKPLMIIVKYWAKTFELSGCGKFTNYAIVMLIVFYLQQPNSKLLPPIVELQKTSEPEYLSNWQVNFDRNAVFPPSTNTNTITELLLAFFKFYIAFPFEKSVISPLDGCAHSRDDFSKIGAEKGDPDYLSLKSLVCLQDPFELDYNITAGVSIKVLKNFQSFCAVGVNVCENALQNKDKPFLLNLFTTLPAPTKNNALIEIVISARKTLQAGLPEDIHTRSDIEDKQKFMVKNWYCVAQRLAEETLRRVFKLDVAQIKYDREMKQQKIAATSDVHSNDNDKIVLECTGNYCVIGERKPKGFCIDPTLSRIDKEAFISDELVNRQKASGVKPTKIDFTCTVHREQNPVRLVLRLKNRNSAKKQFRSLAMFLTTKLPSIVDKELIHMLQYNNR